MWDNIKEAVNIILSGQMKRADGDGWTAYAVGGNIIRVDIKTADYRMQELIQTSGQDTSSPVPTETGE